jgi:hypothetical protein
MVDKIHNFLQHQVEKLNFIFLSFFICIFTLFFSFPPFFSKMDQSIWIAFFEQIKHPFIPIDAPSWSHISKMTFRLFPVFVGKVFCLNKLGFILLMYLVGFLIVLLTLKSFYKATLCKYKSFLLTLSFSLIYAGKLAFLELRGIFDGIALLLLIFSIYNRNVLNVYFSILFASYTDERALIVSGFVFIYFLYLNLSFKNRIALSVFFAWLSYFIIRFSLVYFFGFKTSTGGISLKNLALNFNFFPLSLYSSIEGFWIVLIMFYFLLFKKSKLFFILFSILLSIYFIPCYSVFDVSRSFSFISVLIFISIYEISNNEPYFFTKNRCGVIFILCFLFPTYIFGGNEANWIKPLFLDLVFTFFTNS